MSVSWMVGGDRLASVRAWLRSGFLVSAQILMQTLKIRAYPYDVSYAYVNQSDLLLIGKTAYHHVCMVAKVRLGRI
jgi:hypothetical protein